jgi:hypothetical protein
MLLRFIAVAGSSPLRKEGHTPYITSHASHHTPHITSHASHHTPHITSHASHHITRLTSHASHHITRLTSHASHHITRLTSHHTPHTTSQALVLPRSDLRCHRRMHCNTFQEHHQKVRKSTRQCTAQDRATDQPDVRSRCCTS